MFIACLFQCPSFGLAFHGPTERQCRMEADTMNHASNSDLAALSHLTREALRALWPQWFDRPPPAKLRRELLVRALAYRMQERAAWGG